MALLQAQLFQQKILPLEKPEVFQEFQLLVRDLILYDDAREAYRTYRYLQWLKAQRTNLSVEAPERFRETQAMLVELAWVAIPMLKEEEIVKLLEEHAVKGLFHKDIELWEKLTAKLVGIFVFELRDPFKAKLRAALERNQEVLTPTTIRFEDKTLSGTVGNWLADYRKAAGGGKVSALVRSQYLVNSVNTKALAPVDRERLKKLIDLYERLKLSSLDLDGMEENYIFSDEKGTWVFREGRFIPAVDEETAQFMKGLEAKGLFSYPNLPADEALRRFEEDQQAWKAAVRSAYGAAIDPAVPAQLQQLKSAGKSVKELADLSFDAAVPGPGKRADAGRALACLEFTAETGELAQLLAPGTKFRAWFEGKLKDRNRTQELAALRLRPESPQIMEQFLYAVLVEQLKLKEEDSAKEVVRLANFMAAAGKPYYADLAYFDAEKKQFVWKKKSG